MQLKKDISFIKRLGKQLKGQNSDFSKYAYVHEYEYSYVHEYEYAYEQEYKKYIEMITQIQTQKSIKFETNSNVLYW